MEAAKLPEKDVTPVIPIYEFTGDKIQEISFDQYSKSGRIEGKYGKVLDTKPVQIWHLVSMIMAMADQRGLNNVDLSTIHVSQRDAHATLSDDDKDKGFTQKIAPINRWTFEKSITMLDIPNIGTEMANARMALTLNKNGLSIAFGMNVHECTNFNVMGGTVLRAYSHGGKDSLPWEVIKVRLHDWMDNLNQLWSIQQDWERAMKGYSIEDNEPIIEEIFGDLYLRAIHNAYPKQTKPPAGVHFNTVTPFDTNELSKFAQESLRSRQLEMNNIWDLYNWGTSIMKPGTADIGEIANNSNDWASYLVDRFELDVPEYEVLDD